MGWYPQTYVGPYVEVRSKIVTKRRDNCRNPEKCQDWPKTFKTCPMCAIEMSERFRTERVAERGGGDIFELADEALMYTFWGEADGDQMVFRFVPNARRPGDPSHEGHKDYEALDLTRRDMSADIEWFRTAFAEELAKVEGHYGSLELKWGVIWWGS